MLQSGMGAFCRSFAAQGTLLFATMPAVNPNRQKVGNKKPDSEQQNCTGAMVPPSGGPAPVQSFFREERLALGVLRTFAGLVAAVLLALDLARVARQQTGLAQRGPQPFGGFDQRARDPMAHRIGLRRNSAAFDLGNDVVLALGFGEFERLQDAHPRS